MGEEPLPLPGNLLLYFGTTHHYRPDFIVRPASEDMVLVEARDDLDERATPRPPPTAGGPGPSTPEGLQPVEPRDACGAYDPENWLGAVAAEIRPVTGRS